MGFFCINYGKILPPGENFKTVPLQNYSPARKFKANFETRFNFYDSSNRKLY